VLKNKWVILGTGIIFPLILLYNFVFFQQREVIEEPPATDSVFENIDTIEAVEEELDRKTQPEMQMRKTISLQELEEAMHPVNAAWENRLHERFFQTPTTKKDITTKVIKPDHPEKPAVLPDIGSPKHLRTTYHFDKIESILVTENNKIAVIGGRHYRVGDTIVVKKSTSVEALGKTATKNGKVSFRVEDIKANGIWFVSSKTRHFLKMAK